MAIRVTPKHPLGVPPKERTWFATQPGEPPVQIPDPFAVRAKPGRPSSGKQVVSLRLDPDIIEVFRATGPGWQARINEALRRQKP